MKENWRDITQDFLTIAERDDWIIANANYYTVVRYLGPLNGYERHEVKSLDAAKKLAGRMAKKAGRPYLVYAVADQKDCFVCSVL